MILFLYIHNCTTPLHLSFPRKTITASLPITSVLKCSKSTCTARRQPATTRNRLSGTHGGFPAWHGKPVRDEDGRDGDHQQVYEWFPVFRSRDSEELVDYLGTAFDHQRVDSELVEDPRESR